MAGQEPPERGREGVSLQEVEALLDQKEREMTSQMQRLRHQLSQVMGQPTHSSSSRVAFTGWEGFGKRRETPGELGHIWGDLGRPMMAAMAKNRHLESENRRLREAVAKAKSHLQREQAAGAAGSVRHVHIDPAAWPARGASASSDKARLEPAQPGLPLDLSNSNLSVASLGSSSSAGANGFRPDPFDPTKADGSQAVANTPSFGAFAGHSDLDLLPDFAVPSQVRPHEPKPQPTQAKPAQTPPLAQQASHSQAASSTTSTRMRVHHSDTKSKLEDTLRELADNISTTVPKPLTPREERKDSKKSMGLSRSESFPASVMAEHVMASNMVEGCTKDVQGYGDREVYRDWRMYHLKPDSGDTGENGDQRVRDPSVASSRGRDGAT